MGNIEAKESALINIKYNLQAIKVADELGIDRNEFISHCITTLTIMDLVTDWNDYSIEYLQDQISDVKKKIKKHKRKKEESDVH